LQELQETGPEDRMHCPYCGCESPFIVNRSIDEVIEISVSVILVLMIGELISYNIGKFINW